MAKVLPADPDSIPVAQEKLIHRSPTDIDRFSSEQNLLRQPKTTFYQNPQALNLVAWRLSTDLMKLKDFQKTLKSYRQHH